MDHFRGPVGARDIVDWINQPTILNEERDGRIQRSPSKHIHRVGSELVETNVSSFCEKSLFNSDIQGEGEAIRKGVERSSTVYEYIACHLSGRPRPMRHIEPRIHDDVWMRMRSFEQSLPFLSHLTYLASEYDIYGEVGGTIIAGTINAVYWEDLCKRSIVLVNWSTKKDQIGSQKIDNTSSPFNGMKVSELQKKLCKMHCYAYILEKFYNVTVPYSLFVQLRKNTFNIYRSIPHTECMCRKLYTA